jgi:hypothetical protein
MRKLIQVSAITATMIISGLMASDVIATVDGKNITKQDAQSFVKASKKKGNIFCAGNG